MNFFVFNQQTMRIKVADDFWIYVATWLPLTILTILGYGVVDHVIKPPEQRRHWFSQKRSKSQSHGSLAEMAKHYE